MKIEKPKLSRVLEAKDFGSLDSEEYYLKSCSIQQEIFENQQLHRLQLDDAHVKNCRFAMTDFGRSDFVDVIFENCDFSNAQFTEASIHRVVFQNCKLVGTNFSACSLGNVVFRESVLNLSAISESKLRKVVFENSSAKSVYFYEDKFTEVAFRDCQLDECNFLGTPLKGVDLSTSAFESLTVGFDNLKGCKVSASQAVYFARLLGLIVLE